MTAPFYAWFSANVRGPRVLDVACGTGYVGSLRPDLEWTGVELDAPKADEARGRYGRVVAGRAEAPETIAELGGPFDTIVFCDALEHFVDPIALLSTYLPLLAPGGQVVTAIPNIAHLSVRRSLARGQWRYEDGGLLDRTHLRFYTWHTAIDLLHESGLRVVRTGSNPLVPRLLRPFAGLLSPNLASTHLLAVCERAE